MFDGDDFGDDDWDNFAADFGADDIPDDVIDEETKDELVECAEVINRFEVGKLFGKLFSNFYNYSLKTNEL